ncbi:hypothetical protein EVAR_2215_1 [Eumeta japonica]|uniref:Uncharacterized protein n=1 Tax=Eumeta variegata TaxID=151549 RepID=A0A4C1SFI8_EUMVA|nr:hypothetical protein EVAR_2215_1 [Eumeta japonica]
MKEKGEKKKLRSSGTYWERNRKEDGRVNRRKRKERIPLSWRTQAFSKLSSRQLLFSQCLVPASDTTAIGKRELCTPPTPNSRNYSGTRSAESRPTSSGAFKKS